MSTTIEIPNADISIPIPSSADTNEVPPSPSMEESMAVTVTPPRSDDMSSQSQWPHEEELLLRMWGEQAIGYMWMHERAKVYYSKFHKFLSIPAMIIQSVLSSTIMGNSTYMASEDFRIVIGMFLVLASILKSLTDYYFKTQENYERHRIAALEYRKFSSKIAVQLSLPMKSRDPCRQFLDYSEKKFNSLHGEFPDIPDSILKQYQKQIGNNPNIFKPEIANGVIPIAINTQQARHHATNSNAP